MNIEKLEALLKSQHGDEIIETSLDLNDHKSCYCTIPEHERCYPNIVYKWISEEERQAAYAANEMWQLSQFSPVEKFYRSAAAKSLSAVMSQWFRADEETTKQAEELTAFLHEQMKGEFTTADISYITGRHVGRCVANKTVYSIDNVAVMVVEDDNYTDEDDWVSKEERQKAIDNNGIWTVQIYPNTPIGSYRYHGSSLQAVIDHINEG